MLDSCSRRGRRDPSHAPEADYSRYKGSPRVLPDAREEGETGRPGRARKLFEIGFVRA